MPFEEGHRTSNGGEFGNNRAKEVFGFARTHSFTLWLKNEQTPNFSL